jgi:hypothetical protein
MVSPALPLAVGVLPAEALILGTGAFGLGTDVLGGIGSAVRLAEGVATGDERHSLLVIHRHAGKGLADVFGRGERTRLTVRAFGVDVDEAHLHSGQGLLQIAVAGVALVGEPLPSDPQ